MTIMTRSEAATYYAEDTCYDDSNIPMVRQAYLRGAREEAERIEASSPMIDTAEALELLPEGSVVLSADKSVYMRLEEGWAETGNDGHWVSTGIALPARLLLRG